MLKSKLTQSQIAGLGQANQIDMLSLSYPQADLQSKMFQNVWYGFNFFWGAQVSQHLNLSEWKCVAKIGSVGQKVASVSLKSVAFLSQKMSGKSAESVTMSECVTNPLVRPKMSKSTPWQLAGMQQLVAHATSQCHTIWLPFYRAMEWDFLGMSENWKACPCASITNRQERIIFNLIQWYTTSGEQTTQLVQLSWLLLTILWIGLTKMFLGMPKVSTMHRCEDTYWVYHPIIKIAEAITTAEEFTQVGGST